PDPGRVPLVALAVDRPDREQVPTVVQPAERPRRVTRRGGGSVEPAAVRRAGLAGGEAEGGTRVRGARPVGGSGRDARLPGGGRDRPGPGGGPPHVSPSARRH